MPTTSTPDTAAVSGRKVSFGVLVALGLLAVGFCANLGANTRSYFNSDYTQSLLAAGDIVSSHNPLLHGWVITLDNFYATDTLLYLLLRPLFASNISALTHIPALVYLGIAGLAVLIVNREGQASKSRGLSVVFAALLLASLDLNGAGPCLLVSDQHATTLLLGLAAIGCLQRAERPVAWRDGWPWMAAFGVLLSLAVFSDPFSLTFLTAPLGLYLGFRLLSGIGRRGAAILFAANLLSAIAGFLLMALVRLVGGFHTANYVPNTFADASDLPSNLAGGSFALIQLFGGYVFGKPIKSIDTLVGVFHLLLLLLVVIVAIRAIARNLAAPTKPDFGLVLALSIVVLLAADFSSKAFNIAVAGDLWHGGSSMRYLMPVFVMGVGLIAVEIGGGRLTLPSAPVSQALLAVLMVGACAHFVTVSLSDFRAGRQPPVAYSQPEFALGRWLAQHNLTRGVGDYWEGNAVTALTEGRVVVRSAMIDESSHRLVPYVWNSSRAWADAFDAPQFIVFKTPNDFRLDLPALQRAGFSPIRVENVGVYTVAILAPPTAKAADAP